MAADALRLRRRLSRLWLTLLVLGTAAAATASTLAHAAHATTPVTLTMTDGGSAPMAPGGVLRYRLTVTNHESGPIPSFLVSVELPGVFKLTSARTSSGSYNPRSRRWAGGRLAAGGSATLTLSGTVSSSARGRFVANASLSVPGSGGDPSEVHGLERAFLAGLQQRGTASLADGEVLSPPLEELAPAPPALSA